MKPRGKTLTLIIAAAAIVSLGFSLLLLQSVKIAVVVYVLGIGLVTLLVEPYVGLINYLLFLYLRPQEFIEGFLGVPVMLLIGGATFVVMIINFAMTRKSIAITKAPQNIFMLLLLAAMVLSHLSHVYLHAAIDSGRAFMSTLVMYFLIANLATSEKKMRVTVCLLALLTLFLAAQGIKQYFTGTGLAGQTMIVGRIRGIGIFADPNDLALAFLIVLPFAIFTVIDARNALLRVVSAGVVLTLVYALYLTSSRGGFLSLGVLALLLFTRRFGLAPGLIAGAALFTAIFAFGPSRMEELSPSEASAYGRIAAWGAGLDMLQHNLIFGVGEGSFMDHHSRTAHNSIILCASELGLFGLYVWTMLIFISMKNMFYVSSDSKARGIRSIALFADSILFAFVAFLTAAFFLSRTYNELLYILIGLSAAVTQIFMQRTGERYELIERKDYFSALIITVLLLILMKILVVLFW